MCIPTEDCQANVYFATSNPVVVTVAATPIVPVSGCTLSNSPGVIPASGGTVVQTVTCANGTSPFTYRYSINGIPNTFVSSNPTNFVVNANPTNSERTFSLTVLVTNGSGEFSTTTPVALVTQLAPAAVPPSGCTASPGTIDLTSNGGAVNLSANCTSPISGITYSWTKNAQPFSTAQNPTDTIPANTTTSVQIVTYQATACLAASPQTCTVAPAIVVAVAVAGSPAGCSATASSSSLPPSGGSRTISLTANCTSPSSGISYSWTKNGQSFSTAQNPTDTLPPNITTVAQTYSYQARACLASAPQTCTDSNVAVVTVQPEVSTGAVQPASDTTQVAGPNTLLPQPFVAVLVDPVTGARKAGVAVTWVVVKGDGTLSNQILVSGSDGTVSARFTTGSGNVDNVVRVMATASGSAIDFTVVSQQKVDTATKQVLGPLATTAVTTPAIQINNIRQRLDQVRFQGSAAVTQALRISFDGQALPPLSAFALTPVKKDGKSPTGGGASADTPDPFERWGVFLNGDIDIGKQSTVGTQTGFKLNSKGITLGADYRFEGNHVLGAALGLLKADTDLYAGMGSQDAKGYSLSLYGSYVPVANAYIDGIVNLGHNSYDSQRLQTAGSFASSSTDGNQFALALSAGYAFNQGPLTATPYGRIEYIDAKVNGFTENGPADAALTVSDQKVRATTLSLGGQLSYAISTSWGVLLPYARIEFQHVAQSSVKNVFAGYGGSDPSVVALLGVDKNFGNFAVGTSAIFAKGFSAFFNYEQLFGKDNFSDRKYTLGVRVDF